jgi:serine O-acetyltransferase
MMKNAAGIVESLLGDETGISRRNITYHTSQMPSLSELSKLMSELRGLLFPGFFSPSGLSRDSLRNQLAYSLDSVFRLLSEQIRLGICFACGDDDETCSSCEKTALDMANDFVKKLPEIRDLLDGDVLAAFEGDPAAKSISETIFCYPSIHIMTNHRVAHQLYRLSVPILPRIIGEMAHSRTGIDIHPGASIGPEFFIDHGTGVVIGETAVIGRRCTLYQGVTLGALSFPTDEDGNPIKGLARHPVIEDNVTIYSGATILGRITIGKGSIIGGNVWVTADVPPGSKVVQQRSTTPATTENLVGQR